MRSVIIDKLTGIVQGLDTKADHDSYIIEVPKHFNLEKKIERIDSKTPSRIKRDDQGQILYKDEVKVVNGEEVYKEVHYNRGMKPIKYETKSITERVTKIVRGKPVVLEYSKEVEIPVEFETLEPVTVINYEEVIVSIEESPESFSLNEVMVEKYRDYLISEPLYDNILGDYFFNESDIDLESSSNISLGFGALNLETNGHVKTNPIKLSSKVRRFKVLEMIATDVSKLDISINGSTLMGDVIILPELTDTIVLSFRNTASHENIIESYILGY